jgi:hypothetical protein
VRSNAHANLEGPRRVQNDRRNGCGRAGGNEGERAGVSQSALYFFSFRLYVLIVV